MSRSVIRLKKPPQEAIGDPRALRQRVVKTSVDPPLDWSVRKDG